MRNCIHCGAAVNSRYKYCDDCRDTSSPWRISEFEIDRARTLLGISLPIRVRKTAGKRVAGRHYGVCTADNGGRYHYITIAARLTPEQASRTLWHEMTHAAQHEQDPNFTITYMTQRILFGYRDCPLEVEAKANEEYHDTEFSLTKGNRRASMAPLKRPVGLINEVVNGEIVSGNRLEARDLIESIRVAEAKIKLGR